MNFRTAKKGRSMIINVTSLIDVMFLLLIFFMVTSTFRNQPAINLVLPRSSTASDTVDTPTILFLTESGQVYLNDSPLGTEYLAAALEQLHATTGDDRIVVRADGKASYERVVEMIDTIRQSGFTRVSLSAKQPTAP